MKITLRSLFLDTAVAALIIVAAKGASHPYSFVVFLSLEYLALRFCLSPRNS